LKIQTLVSNNSVSKAKISRLTNTGPDTENTDHGPDMGFYGPLVNQSE
jgi:hypothetical protein